MSTYTQILYHIVFATKDRQPVLSDSRRDELFMYMNGVIKNNHCRPVWMNGVTVHKTTFLEEYRKLLHDAGIKFEEKYFP